MSKLLLLPGERLSSTTRRNGRSVGGWGACAGALVGSGQGKGKRLAPLATHANRVTKNLHTYSVNDSPKAPRSHRSTDRAQQISQSYLLPATRALPPAACVLPPATCVLPPAACVLPPAACVLPPADCVLPSATCVLPPATCVLPSGICVLPSGTCVLPSATCVLPSAACVLPSAACFLPSAACVVRKMRGVLSFIFRLPLKDLRDLRNLKDTRDSCNRAPDTVPYVH